MVTSNCNAPRPRGCSRSAHQRAKKLHRPIFGKLLQPLLELLTPSTATWRRTLGKCFRRKARNTREFEGFFFGEGNRRS